MPKTTKEIMKLKDILVFVGAVVFFLPFFIFDSVYQFYLTFNTDHAFLMSFIKFAILATFGESIGSRIKTGNFMNKGFGLIPRAVIWGLLGITIKISFDVFSGGTLVFLSKAGFTEAVDLFKSPDFSIEKLGVAFCISFFLNLVYAPFMMTTHKITDMHIGQNKGKLKTLITPIKFGKNMANLNWNVQWNFVFKRTIPFFWIPMHTITFILPEHFRVLFAAVLGIALGIILAIASLKSK